MLSGPAGEQKGDLATSEFRRHRVAAAACEINVQYGHVERLQIHLGEGVHNALGRCGHFAAAVYNHVLQDDRNQRLILDDENTQAPQRRLPTEGETRQRKAALAVAPRGSRMAKPRRDTSRAGGSLRRRRQGARLDLAPISRGDIMRAPSVSPAEQGRRGPFLGVAGRFAAPRGSAALCGEASARSPRELDRRGSPPHCDAVRGRPRVWRPCPGFSGGVTRPARPRWPRPAG